MVLSNQKALGILGLPAGSDSNSVLQRYHQLAMKSYSEFHENKSPESQKKFIQLTQAYKKLTCQNFKQDLSLADCLAFLKQVNSRNRSNGTKYASSESSDSEEEYESDSETDDESPANNHSRVKNCSDGNKTSNTEEERERKKAEKRRAKKKRQRERKRMEKEQNKNNTAKKGTDKNKESRLHDNQDSSDETGFDPTSAFFTKVVSKKKKNAANDQSNIQKGKHNDDEGEDIVDPKVLRSRQLAVRGNEMAQVDQYTAAIQLFTEAISLDPTDFRFFGNRSYCYDRTEQYDKALRDADKAIHLDKNWPKGYFRKGRALSGLKIFTDAEKAFLQVLKLDKNCEDAVSELFYVRVHQLMDMGFSKVRSEAAITKHNSVQTALDSLLTGCGDSFLSDLYISDDENGTEGFSVHRPAPILPLASNPSDVKMDPTNPEGLTALWVGNVLPSVTEKRLNQLFSKFGQVTSVRPLPEKFCAFVNFKTKEAAGRAMHQLQGTEVDGQKLKIKFPDNPVTSNASGNITIRKPITSSGPVKQGLVKNVPKVSGPVNGDECYFWRTTGCTFGGDCKWQHYPKSKGIDKRPWQK